MLQYLDLWNGFHTAQTFPEMLRILPPRFVSENLDFTYETRTEWGDEVKMNTVFRGVTLLQMPERILLAHGFSKERERARLTLKILYNEMCKLGFVCVKQQVGGYQSGELQIGMSFINYRIQIFKLLKRMPWTLEERERLLTLNGRKQFSKDELSNICDWCSIPVLGKWKKTDYVKALIDYLG
jgi:hypothetical protein